MKRDADQVIQGFVNPDGSGNGNWSDETVVGRITNRGSWDRRFKIDRRDDRCRQCGAPKHPRIYGSPAKPNQDSTSLREFAAALMVCLMAGAAFIIWSSILAVWN